MYYKLTFTHYYTDASKFGELEEHLIANNYDFAFAGKSIFILEDHYFELKTILDDRGIEYITENQ